MRKKRYTVPLNRLSPTLPILLYTSKLLLQHAIRSLTIQNQMDTINKLLKKQAPKRRGKIAAAETAGDTTPRIQEAQEPEKPEPTMTRYISNRNGCKIGVPEEWLETPA